MGRWPTTSRDTQEKVVRAAEEGRVAAMRLAGLPGPYVKESLQRLLQQEKPTADATTTAAAAKGGR